MLATFHACHCLPSLLLFHGLLRGTLFLPAHLPPSLPPSFPFTHLYSCIYLGSYILLIGALLTHGQCSRCCCPATGPTKQYLKLSPHVVDLYLCFYILCLLSPSCDPTHTSSNMFTSSFHLSLTPSIFNPTL